MAAAAGGVRAGTALTTRPWGLYYFLVMQLTGYVQPAARLDATFAALADPTRRAILARLLDGEASVGELAEPFAMSQPAISKHLKVLERAGLVSRGRDAQRRPCKIEAGPLEDVAAWIARYRELWEERLKRLDAVLDGLKSETKRKKKRRVKP